MSPGHIHFANYYALYDTYIVEVSKENDWLGLDVKYSVKAHRTEPHTKLDRT